MISVIVGAQGRLHLDAGRGAGPLSPRPRVQAGDGLLWSRCQRRAIIEIPCAEDIFCEGGRGRRC